MRKILSHISEYVARYSVLAIAVLTPTSALLGTVAADLGGIDTGIGKALLAVSAALGTAAAGVVFIRNLGIWQILNRFEKVTSLGGLVGELTKPAPKVVVEVTAPPAPAPAVVTKPAPAKPHKPITPPPVVPGVTPPIPQPAPTHPAPATKPNPVASAVDVFKDTLNKIIPKGK